MAGEDFTEALEAYERTPHEFRIYLDDKADLHALVDEIDYHWAIQWRWSAKHSKGSANVYPYRTLSFSRLGRRSVYLHIEILKRSGVIQPDGFDIGDHRDGKTLDCRRKNLRWATTRMNSLNVRGRYPTDDLIILAGHHNEYEQFRQRQLDAINNNGSKQGAAI